MLDADASCYSNEENVMPDSLREIGRVSDRRRTVENALADKADKVPFASGEANCRKLSMKRGSRSPELRRVDKLGSEDGGNGQRTEE